MGVLTNKVYTPQGYIEEITDRYYILNSRDTIIEQIENLLAENDIYDVWNYPLNEIDHIIENKLDVVLIDVTDIGDDGELVAEHRWFEVPSEYCHRFKE